MTLEQQLEQLREGYKATNDSSMRLIIELRANLLKKAIEIRDKKAHLTSV